MSFACPVVQPSASTVLKLKPRNLPTVLGDLRTRSKEMVLRKTTKRSRYQLMSKAQAPWHLQGQAHAADTVTDSFEAQTTKPSTSMVLKEQTTKPSDLDTCHSDASSHLHGPGTTPRPTCRPLPRMPLHSLVCWIGHQRHHSALLAADHRHARIPLFTYTAV